MNDERRPAEPSDDPAPTIDDDLPDSSADADAPVEPEAVAAQAEASLVAELEPIAEAAAAISADEVDATFGEHLDPETLAFGAPKPQAIVCQWCNGPLDSIELEVCPHCGSRLKPTDEDLVVPGVTTLSSEAARALELVEIQRNREAAKAGQAMYATPSLSTSAAVVPAPDEATIEAANRPPDDEVRRLMLEMELEARQARASAAARSDIEAMIVDDAEHEMAADDADAPGTATPAEPGDEAGGVPDAPATGPDAASPAGPDAASGEADASLEASSEPTEPAS